MAAFDRDELFAAWRRFFERVSDAAPTVLVFEDLHWADPSLLDFVEHLAAWTRNHPILIVALTRPELLERRPTWGAGIGSFTALHLERLTDDAMRELLIGRAPDVAQTVVAQTLERAGGVPLYAVEVVRILADTMIADGEPGPLQVPDSLQGVIATRIDALEPPARRLLLAAAVLGRRFRAEELLAVADSDAGGVRERIDGLVRRELLAVDDEPGSPGQGELNFVQDLVREVAYRMLARDERRALHLAAARHLEGRPDEDLVESLAGHLVDAHGIAPEHPDASRVARRAVSALRRAAQRTLQLHVPKRALGHLEHALGLVDNPEQRAVVLEEAAAAARAAARLDLAEEYLRELIELRKEAGHPRDAARARAQLASVLLMAQHNETAIAELESALRANRDIGRDAAGVELASQLARARMLVGDDRGGLEWAERALSAAERLGLDAVATDLLVTRGSARFHLGDQTGGLADLRQAISEAEGASALNTELRARNNLAWLVVADDPLAAMDTAREAVELATAMGVRDMAVQLAAMACAVAVETGDWDWALKTAADFEHQAIADAHRIDLAVSTGIILALQGAPTPTSKVDALAATAAATDAQLRAGIDHTRAWAAFVAGDFADAHRLAASGAAASFGAERIHQWTLATRASLWMGARDAAADTLESLSALHVAGRATEAAVETLSAGVAALDGDPDAALRYRRAAEAWRGLELPVQLALCELDAYRLLPDAGLPHEAIAILEDHGASGLVHLVEARERAAISPPAARPPRARSRPPNAGTAPPRDEARRPPPATRRSAPPG
jgi:tetratricopeptide (TPR) repeat protein